MILQRLSSIIRSTEQQRERLREIEAYKDDDPAGSVAQAVDGRAIYVHYRHGGVDTWRTITPRGTIRQMHLNDVLDPRD